MPRQLCGRTYVLFVDLYGLGMGLLPILSRKDHAVHKLHAVAVGGSHKNLKSLSAILPSHMGCSVDALCLASNKAVIHLSPTPTIADLRTFLSGITESTLPSS